MSSVFQRTIEEYTAFNNDVAQYQNLVETDPSSLTNGNGLANEITAVSLNGSDPNFDLIEHSSWMVDFGQQFVAAVGEMVGSKTSSTISTQGGQSLAVTDQNGDSITGASASNGDATSITFTIPATYEYGGHVNWDLPAGLDLSQAATSITYGEGSEGVKIPRSMTVTLTGSAMQQFLAQAVSSGIFSFATLSTSTLMNVLQGCF